MKYIVLVLSLVVGSCVPKINTADLTTPLIDKVKNTIWYRQDDHEYKIEFSSGFVKVSLSQVVGFSKMPYTVLKVAPNYTLLLVTDQGIKALMGLKLLDQRTMLIHMWPYNSLYSEENALQILETVGQNFLLQ